MTPKVRGQLLERSPGSGLHVFQELVRTLLNSGTSRANTRPKWIGRPGCRREPLKLRSMPGVQSAELKDGVVDLQFLGGSTSPQREAAVKQLAALGDVYEGV